MRRLLSLSTAVLVAVSPPLALAAESQAFSRTAFERPDNAKLAGMPIVPLLMRNPSSGGGGSAPAYVSTGSHSTNSITANYPASIAAGDFLLATVVANGSADVEYTGSGWTRITKVMTTGTNGIVILAVFYKVASGSESGTFAFTQTGTFVNQQTAAISRFTGVSSFESLLGKQTTNSTTVAISSPATSTAGSNRLIVNIFGTPDPSNLTEEAGWTEAFDYMNNGSGASDYGLAMHYIASSGTGTQTTEEPTPSVSGSAWAMVSLALVGTGSMPTTSISVRGSRATWVNNANSIAFSLPPSSAAGDLCVIEASHGWGVTTPSGWVQLFNQTGSNTNGAAFCRLLTAADISTGSVTISFAGTYYGVVKGVTYVGCTGGLRQYAFSRNSSGSSTRNVTTASGPQTGDHAIYMGEGRGNTTITCNQGSSLQTTSNSEGSGSIYGGTLGSSGAVSATFSFSAVPSGDMSGIVTVAPSA